VSGYPYIEGPAMDIAHRRYIVRTLAFMGGYSVVNIAAIAGAFDDVSGAGAWLLGLAVAAPVAGQIWATLALMHDADEFVRALTAKRFILAAGLAIALFSAWGFMESYAEAPHAPGWLVYPLFWACFGVAAPFVRTTR
jgi:putative oxidoreductase